MAGAHSVLVQRDFVPPAACAELVGLFRAAARASQEVLSTPYRTEVAATLAVEDAPALRVRVDEIRARARVAVASLYGCGDRLQVEYTLFSEMRVGDSHVLHADAERREPSGQWGPNHTPWRHSVALLYLNSYGIDFDGGELVLPDLGRRISPRAGELVAFPSTHEFCHAVSTVTRGSRCTLAIWMTEDADYRERWP